MINEVCEIIISCLKDHSKSAGSIELRIDILEEVQGVLQSILKKKSEIQAEWGEPDHFTNYDLVALCNEEIRGMVKLLLIRIDEYSLDDQIIGLDDAIGLIREAIKKRTRRDFDNEKI